MAGDDDEPVGAQTMQVDSVADALDVLESEESSIAPPALPPPLPPRGRKFPIVAALIAGVVAIGAAILVGELLEPDAPAATAPAASTAAEEPSHGTRIDLGPILVQASHDGDAAVNEAVADEAVADSP